MLVLFIKYTSAIVAVALLQACVLRPAPSFQAVPDYFRSGANLVGTALSAGVLNPQLTYLHITLGDEPPALMVLGYVDSAQPHQAAVLTWYSATGQTLQTQQGRLVALYGLQGGPSQVRYSPSPVAWPTTLQPVPLQRQWDVPTLYQYNLQEARVLHTLPTAEVPRQILRHIAKHLLPHVPGGVPPQGSQAHPSSWSWYVEQGPAGPVSWYATTQVQGIVQVVYSFQCINTQQCLHLAPWPLAGVVLP